MPLLSRLSSALPPEAIDLLNAAHRIARIRSSARRVRALPRRGRCESCGRSSLFLVCANTSLMRRMGSWPYDESFFEAVATRENHFCVWCGRNLRMRQVARVAHRYLRGADVYEAARFGVFSGRLRSLARSYSRSEYFGEKAPGTMVRGLRHEDVTRLSFPDASFDLVITSEVFEHVVDPMRGFAEIRRVLRLGGRHVFSIPYVTGQPTRDRGNLEPVYHSDPMRADGAIVHTDFGDDLPDLLAPIGFATRIHEIPATAPVARVYESEAV